MSLMAFSILDMSCLITERFDWGHKYQYNWSVNCLLSLA